MTDQVVGKAVIQSVVDNTGLDAGVAQGKKSLAGLGQAATAAGKEASAAIGGIGNGSEQAAGRVDRATRTVADSMRRIPGAAGEAGSATDKLTATQARFLASLERQATILTQGKAGYLELKAAQLGVAEAASASIAALKKAEQGQDAVGMSAKAMQAALRGVPAQFTDIAVSLSSGQKPITVLLQQGGQLKDMFGGIGPAARALGGYIAGLVTPVTVGAAAIAGLVYAAHQGAEELRGFQNAAALTGNAAGLSASGFTRLRDELSAIAGTKGKAAEVLTEIARNGQIAAGNVRLISEAAVLMEKATGQAIGKTVAEFAKLADSPAAAAKELNQQYNFLTASTYAQIKALEEDGKRAQAADLAERSLAEALKTRAAGVVENVGTIEKAWRGARDVAKSAWDAMLGVGRELSPAERLAKAAGDAARLQAEIAGVGTFADTGGGAAVGRVGGVSRAALQRQLEAAQRDMRDAFRTTEITDSNAASAAARAAAQKEASEAIDKASASASQYASKQTQLNNALDDYRKQLAKIRQEAPDAKDKFGRLLLDPKVIAETEAGIRKAYTDTTGENGVAQQSAARRIAIEENKRLQASIDSLDFSTPTKLTEGEKRVIQIQEELKGSLVGKARAMKQAELAAAQAAVQDEKSRVTLENQYEAVKKSVEIRQQQIATVGAEATSIRQLAAEQTNVNANYGKSKTAIEEVRLAEIRKQLAEADATDTFDPKYVASLRLKAEAQADYVKRLQQAEYLQKSRQLDEAGRVSAEDTATLQLELSLVGRTQQEREKIIAQRKVEVALAKELAAIDKLNLGEGDEADRKREELRAKARANAVVDANNAAAKAVLSDWQRTADSINQSLTDALLRGFESGKGFAQNLRDTLKNMFGTLVLRPIVQAIMAPVSGALAGIGQSIGGSITGGGGSILGSLFGGSGGGFPSAGSFVLNGASALGSIGTLGSQVLGGTMSLGNAGATLFANATGAGLDGLLGATGAFGTAAEGAGILGTASGALASIGPVGWAALAAIAVGSLLGKKGGGPKTESAYGSGVQLGGTNYSESAARGVVDSIQQQYQSIAKAIGINPGDLTSGVRISQDPKGTAKTMLWVEAQLAGQNIYSRDARLGGVENVGRSPEELQAAIAEEMQRVTLAALQHANIGGPIGDALRQLGDEAKLTAQQVSDAVTQIQKVATERQQLQDRLFNLTATDAEKLAKVRDQERAAVDGSNRSLLEQIYQQEDLKKAADDAKAAVANLSTALDTALSSYRTSTTAGIGRNEAFAQIQAALAISKAGGPLPDMEKLKDAISVISQPNEAGYRTQRDFLSARDSEAALLQQLQAQINSGTVQTPAVVAAGSAATASSVQSTSALQALIDAIGASNSTLATVSDATETTARILRDAANGGVSLAVDSSPT